MKNAKSPSTPSNEAIPGWASRDTGAIPQQFSDRLNIAENSTPVPPILMKTAAPELRPEPAANNEGWLDATATAYNGKDDQFGTATAKPNPEGKFEAVPGQTIAVDPSVIPYGSHVEVKHKDGTIGKYFAHDTGSAVKAKTASKGRGNALPVIDFYTPKDDLIGFNDKIGDVVQYRIVPNDQA